jgi:hypothetical protein
MAALQTEVKGMTLRRPLLLCALVAAGPLAGAARLSAAEGEFDRDGTFKTTNFRVHAPDRELAQKFGEMAEQYRREKARDWLGKEMPPWPQRCPLQVTINLKQSGGATEFSFGADASGRSSVASQNMKIWGETHQLLYSVLPHEVTHTVLAYHFGRPVPRWADEGGSVLSENEDECFQHDIKNREILNQGRGIRLRVLFTLKEYPRDMLVVYAQGYSVCNYLVARGGRQKLLEFVGQGMRNDNRNWDAAVREVYGFGSVDELEEAWIDSLRSPPTRVSARNRSDIAKADPAARRSEIRSSGVPALPLLEAPAVARGAAPDKEPARGTSLPRVSAAPAKADPPPKPLLLPPEPPRQ